MSCIRLCCFTYIHGSTTRSVFVRLLQVIQRDILCEHMNLPHLAQQVIVPQQWTEHLDSTLEVCSYLCYIGLLEYNQAIDALCYIPEINLIWFKSIYGISCAFPSPHHCEDITIPWQPYLPMHSTAHIAHSTPGGVQLLHISTNNITLTLYHDHNCLYVPSPQ